VKQTKGHFVISPSGNKPNREQGQEESMNDNDAARAYGLQEGEGEARWWLGGMATIKATGKETGGHYALVEVLDPEGPPDEAEMEQLHALCRQYGVQFPG